MCSPVWMPCRRRRGLGRLKLEATTCQRIVLNAMVLRAEARANWPPCCHREAATVFPSDLRQVQPGTYEHDGHRHDGVGGPAVM
jgi:hypothetical protein